jgi:hypothetical protein
MEEPNETNHSKIIMTNYLSGLTEIKKKSQQELNGEQDFEHAS